VIDVRSAARAVAVVPAVLALLAVAGCAGLTGGGRAASAEPAGTAAIASWSQPAGIAPELVYVTEIDGFDLATQSVGVMGDDGMSAAYVRLAGGDGGTVMLTTARGPATAVAACDELPDTVEAPLRCSVERGDAYVVLEGQGVEASTLRAAADAVRVPREDELDHLFTDLPALSGTPVERGDLPPGGDGAPIDPPGAGG
jgi:hypothetical protein